ncbi:Transcriptional regulatory protein moc3 [Madurella mycetomatis]|uniref:Transcriptional regulatory protein moc3 n=1 Tax=Madurella mycetomatis TaxID=100816 RepID=A0A175W596_9PEZI|nr:Transcriptional regulatory protein moc3 [Madurella mycetomatis]
MAESPQSGAGPGSNRSSLSPSASTTSDAPKKRTRASKPKVRTGCITIRRVKCGEEKPACLRCTSTGRTCDGYDTGMLPRSPRPDPVRTAELAKAEFVKACQQSEALRSMRRIEADIDGTDTERCSFSRSRTVTADDLAALFCPFRAFWIRVAPFTNYQDGALKHAVIALGAAYRLFQRPDEPVPDGSAQDSIDVFTIQHYNKSIEQLQYHVGSSTPESIRMTLLCCLAFISIETLRGNHAVAVTHLINGLRILQSLPASAFDCLADGSMFVWPPTRDTLDMPDIIQLFARLELLACFFTHGIQPVIAERGYRTRRFDDGSAEGPFADLFYARRALCNFQHDVAARLHEISAASAAGKIPLFWSDPSQQRQQSCLSTRSARLGALTDAFLSRFTADVDPNTPEVFSLFLDLLYFRCAQLQLFLASPTTTPLPFPYQGPAFQESPYSSPAVNPLPTNTHPLEDHLRQILHLTSRLAASPFFTLNLSTACTRTRSLTDTHLLLGPLHLVARHTTTDSTRTAAVRLLAEAVRRAGGVPGLDAARQYYLRCDEAVGVGRIERAVRANLASWKRDDDAGGTLLCGEAPRALIGAGCLPRLWDVLVGVEE